MGDGVHGMHRTVLRGARTLCMSNGYEEYSDDVGGFRVFCGILSVRLMRFFPVVGTRHGHSALFHVLL
jgi:hypothetical protein